MSDYNNDMQMILEKAYSDNPNGPALRASLEINGQKYKVSLWQWITQDGRHINDKNGGPKFKGKIEVDNWVPDGQQQPQQQQPYQQPQAQQQPQQQQQPLMQPQYQPSEQQFPI